MLHESNYDVRKPDNILTAAKRLDYTLTRLGLIQRVARPLHDLLLFRTGFFDVCNLSKVEVDEWRNEHAKDEINCGVDGQGDEDLIYCLVAE
jgi:hypothetical protein